MTLDDIRYGGVVGPALYLASAALLGCALAVAWIDARRQRRRRGFEVETRAGDHADTPSPARTNTATKPSDGSSLT